MTNQGNPPVTIARKHKRTRWLLHAITFAFTGGTSALPSAAVVAHNASYNRETRKLAEQAAPAAADSSAPTVAEAPASAPAQTWREGLEQRAAANGRSLASQRALERRPRR